MTRSRRKSPVIPHANSESEKDDKIRAHRKERHSVKTKLSKTLDGDAVAAEHKRAGDFKFAKGGKDWLKKPTAKDLRK